MSFERGLQRLGCGGESNLELVANLLEDGSAVGLDRSTEGQVVDLQGLLHPFRFTFPKRCGTLDIGE